MLRKLLIAARLLVILLLANMLLVNSIVAYAGTTDVKVETTGYGDTYREALLNALLDAVAQVRGLQTSTKEFLKLEFQQIVKGDAASASIQSIGVEERVSTRVKGWLKSYRVISSGKDKKDGHWVVEISALVPKPAEGRLKDSRKTLAVMPFRVSQTALQIDSGDGETKTVSAIMVSKRLADQLRVNFSQLGKVSVVNRQFGPEVFSEQALLSSELVPASEAANLGSVIGADYLLLGNIYRFETELKDRKFYNAKIETAKDRIELYYQVVDAYTQKIIWANTIDFEFDKEKEQTLHEKLSDDEKYLDLADTLTALSGLISSEVLSHLYPPKVVSISGQQLYISHGATALKIGTLLNIYNPGRTLKDPDTGRTLLLDGERLGQAEIIDLRPDYAVASLISGDLNQINDKVALRRASVDAKSQPIEDKRYSTPGESDAPVSW